MVEKRELPNFKYVPDPIKAGVIIKKDAICQVCNEKTDYIYIGPFTSYEEIENICPWCIKYGLAVEKYEGEFYGVSYNADISQEEYSDELAYRTPSFDSCDSEVEWLIHCKDYCAFLGYVDWEDIMGIKEQINDDIEEIKDMFNLTQEELEKELSVNGFLKGFLFQCIKCGQYRLTVHTS